LKKIRISDLVESDHSPGHSKVAQDLVTIRPRGTGADKVYVGKTQES
jgi:hypothetical protein